MHKFPVFYYSTKSQKHRIFFFFFDINMMKRSQPFTLSFIIMKSVSFLLSNSVLNSYYQTFDEMRETITMTTTQSNCFLYIPYIIYYYKPIYLTTNVIIIISKEKGLRGSQLIGITCCFSAAFFIILFFIIKMYQI